MNLPTDHPTEVTPANHPTDCPTELTPANHPIEHPTEVNIDGHSDTSSPENEINQGSPPVPVIVLRIGHHPEVHEVQQQGHRVETTPLRELIREMPGMHMGYENV